MKDEGLQFQMVKILGREQNFRLRILLERHLFMINHSGDPMSWLRGQYPLFLPRILC